MQNLFDKFKAWRMKSWLLVWLLEPQQLLVSLYKLSLVSIAAVAGYWIDRSVNKLIEELSTQAITAFDVELRFKTLAASGDPK